MSTFPVNGYFKQLENYSVAKAGRANHSAQMNSATQSSDSELATDSVALSSDSAELSRPVRPPNCYSYLDTLTTSDKAVVKAAGWDIDADPLGENASPAVKAFVGRLNLDRASGNLKGDIDGAYLDNVIAQQLQGQDMVPLSVLYQAKAYLSQGAAKH